MTRNELEAAELYHCFIRIVALTTVYTPDTLAIFRELVTHERVGAYEPDEKVFLHAMLRFIDTCAENYHK